MSRSFDTFVKEYIPLTDIMLLSSYDIRCYTYQSHTVTGMLLVGICGVVASILLDSILQNILFRLCFCPFAVYTFFRESAGPPKMAKSAGPAAYAASAIWLIRP